jgi:hypothetical protein
MIKIENVEIAGLNPAIRGMRNPMNSWDKSDSGYCDCFGDIGEADEALMNKLKEAGTDHRKFMRMIVIYMDITAPLYWWKEFDTYKVGTVANSCSTMHKIADKRFEPKDFSCEHLYKGSDVKWGDLQPKEWLEYTIYMLNVFRERYLETKNKNDWWQMIQMLPSSYNQKRTVMISLEALTRMYEARKDHKLDEWQEFCDVVEGFTKFDDINYMKY